MRLSSLPVVESVVNHRWNTWVHAALLTLGAVALFFVPWMPRAILLAVFAAIFFLTLTGFFLLVSGLALRAASAGASLDREAITWLFIFIASAGLFLAAFLVISPKLSVERLALFVSVSALAVGFLQVRFAQRLRRFQGTYKKSAERLRGFAAVSTTFFLLLLMPAIYGERFGIVVLAAYCVFFALELLILLRPLP